ncbi:hypothetical protein B0T14DRAFT_527369 [Immersiella caudata]|uniref:Uncharacterized protein n=1 Tax=Immersiella caudata TaxID=314043 RepID=A0AA39WEK3_9PEZI|nr:hypothetical protein B0T14DRAFT_527369 [Immersiella caudata]
MSLLLRKSILTSFLAILSLSLTITSKPTSPSPSKILSTRTAPLCATPDPSLPLWIIYEWSTDFSTPENPIIMFLLENTLTGYTALCFREGPYPEGLCARVVEKGGEGEDEDTTGTIFSYNERVGVLEVYQEWDCDGGESVG